MLSRRDFLDRSGAVLAGLALRPVPAAALMSPLGREPDLLVVIVLRGGADGLGMVVPFTDREYYGLRPTIAVPPPGAPHPDRALDLDGQFALNPHLSPLLPLYQNGTLAIVHACGLPAASRSHLLEQQRLEDMLRALAEARGGEATVFDARRPGARRPDDPVAHGAGLRGALRRISRAVSSEPEVRTAIAESTAWDHHAAQAGRGGALASRLDDLATSVSGFVHDLGDRMANTAIVTVSEFGRSVAENAHAGTDHGSGSAMFVIGGNLRGGRVYGRWPGLHPAAQSDGGIAVTTDVRDVIAASITPGLLRTRWHSPGATSMWVRGWS